MPSNASGPWSATALFDRRAASMVSDSGSCELNIGSI
jgi:hypothetical protein